MRPTTANCLAAILLAAAAGSVSARKPLGHDAFDSWQRTMNYALSNDGRWSAYGIVPQEGDATLVIETLKGDRKIEIPRGYNIRFTADSRYAVALVKPFFADTRKAKIDGKKGFDLPHDSLAVIDLRTGDVEKIPHVASYRIGERGGHWLAYQSLDTLHASKEGLKDKKGSRPLVVRDLDTPVRKTVKWVKDYSFSRDGLRLAMTVCRPDCDTVTADGVGLMLLPDTAFVLADRDRKFYGAPVFDESGSKLAFVAGNDTVESGTRRLSLFLLSADEPMKGAEECVISAGASDSRDLHVNQYSEPVFSRSGDRLVVGVAPHIAPDDTTIVDFETATLDIWRWDAPMTPPQENINIETLRKKTLPVVVDLKNSRQQLVTQEMLATVLPPDRWEGEWTLVADPSEDIVSSQWDYLYPVKLSAVNLADGTRRDIGKVCQERYALSPCGKYAVWFDGRHYQAYDMATGETVCMTRDIEVPLWNVDNDTPSDAEPYGIAAWTDGDRRVLVYDKYDIWSVDPSGKTPSVSLTAGAGRKSGNTFRHIRRKDADKLTLSDGEKLLLSVFNNDDKRCGLASVKLSGKGSAPVVHLLDKASFTQVLQARDADAFSWQRASFEIKPDIWGTGTYNLSKARQLSDSNPQMADYSWGTAQLVEWTAYDGKQSQGVLYLPEGFNESESYPMLTVFYETGSEKLYTHYTMEPSWSWVNYPFYVSRGYVVFVPDIHYTAGIPGESCYNYVCSGVEAICDRYPQIDRKRIGIDGQSWGGYQTAYLVTRTDMFACAGSGAPVSNMTSAFGGIRWESGDSRQAQYEQGQSRIGRTLWEAPELYIANSPLFHADRCHTPLLIMHNDADGAVPWYQGIEMFMALRRLERPVWMLQYNGEAHNLRERRNRKDITVRLQQFFDHYLKGEPMPRWMKEGIPALRKGQENGY